MVKDTQSKEFGEYEIWPDVFCTHLPWPPHPWLLMSWRNPWPPVALNKSDRDSHHWLHKSSLASVKRKLENVCAQLKTTTPLSSPIYMLTTFFRVETNRANFFHLLAYLGSYYQEPLTSMPCLIQICKLALAHVSPFPVLFFSMAFYHQLTFSIFYFLIVPLTLLKYLQCCKQFGSLFFFFHWCSPHIAI